MCNAFAVAYSTGLCCAPSEFIYRSWKGERYTVTCMASVSTDYGHRVGFAPVEEAVEVILNQNGEIKEFTVMVTPDSCAS